MPAKDTINPNCETLLQVPNRTRALWQRHKPMVRGKRQASPLRENRPVQRSGPERQDGILCPCPTWNDCKKHHGCYRAKPLAAWQGCYRSHGRFCDCKTEIMAGTFFLTPWHLAHGNKKCQKCLVKFKLGQEVFSSARYKRYCIPCAEKLDMVWYNWSNAFSAIMI